MAKSDLDNANPTVLSVSQLPSRNLAKGHVRKGPDSKYDHILFPKQWWAGSSLNTDPSVWTSDEDEDDDLTLATEEPIDEQEIYGENYDPSSCTCIARRSPCFNCLSRSSLFYFYKKPTPVIRQLMSCFRPAINDIGP